MNLYPVQVYSDRLPLQQSIGKAFKGITGYNKDGLPPEIFFALNLLNNKLAPGLAEFAASNPMTIIQIDDVIADLGSELGEDTLQKINNKFSQELSSFKPYLEQLPKVNALLNPDPINAPIPIEVDAPAKDAFDISAAVAVNAEVSTNEVSA